MYTSTHAHTYTVRAHTHTHTLVLADSVCGFFVGNYPFDPSLTGLSFDHRYTTAANGQVDTRVEVSSPNPDPSPGCTRALCERLSDVRVSLKRRARARAFRPLYGVWVSE